MSGKKEITSFLIMVLAPFVLIFAGAGMVGLGFTQDWGILIIPGLVVAGVGLLWGVGVLLFHGPMD